MASTIKILDPVQGLIDYTNDIKPYHTKVIEALIEYVGQDTLSVSVFEDFAFTIESLYEFDGNYICLIGGYGTPYFGDPENLLVSSPDVSKTILEYPAIGPGFFIVLGDKTVLFDPTVNINLSIISSIEDKIVGVNATGSPSTGSFIVSGDKAAEYIAAGNFSVVGSVGSPNNDSDYTVVSAVYQPVGSPPVNATVITVTEVVPSTSVEGFASILDSTNTGTFAVISSEYTDKHRNPFTTVFVTGVSLVPPTFTSITHPNRRFVSIINSQPLVYDRILSYSNALRLYETSSPPMPYYVADEGVVIAGIVNLSSSPSSFSVLGNFQSSNLFVGDEFVVEDSSGNDGTYNITSLTYEFAGSPVNDFVTTFGVTAIPDTNIDGNVKLNIPSNVFIIDSGDYTRFFVQGSRVNTTSGSHIGRYTTLNSQFFNNKTHIRVRETLIDEGTGRLIIGTGANYIAVDGNVESIYGGSPAQLFNIVGSLRNDGSYTTASATYDMATKTTQISIVEPFDITDSSGEIHEFASGDITHLPEGFGATVDLCELVPQALSISSITEDFKVSMGHKFRIEATVSGSNEIHIQDDNGYVYNIFTAGSPPDTLVEIIDSGINNGQYTIIGVAGGSPSTTTVLTVGGSLQDSGGTPIAGSPPFESGFLLYQNWWQYYVTNIPAGSPVSEFVVSGDARGDIAGSPPSTIQHVFTGNPYTVNSVIFDSITNTTSITVNEDIQTTRILLQPPYIGSPPFAGSPPVIVDVRAGSPPFDDWIISI